MHVHKRGKSISEFNFYYGKNYGTREFPVPSNNCVLLEYTTTYKYLDWPNYPPLNKTKYHCK